MTKRRERADGSSAAVSLQLEVPCLCHIDRHATEAGKGRRDRISAVDRGGATNPSPGRAAVSVVVDHATELPASHRGQRGSSIFESGPRSELLEAENRENFARSALDPA